MIKLYEDDGWINVPSIANLKANFNIFIGPRQVGKTYGTLKHMITNGIKFIFTRRTSSELDTALKGSTSVFSKLGRDLGFTYEVEIESQFIKSVHFYRDGVEFLSCIALALTSISRTRGFSCDSYTDWVYDEMIPEISVRKIKGEGDAFVNAYITMNGNRELEGRPALRCWLLANSNDLYSPILAELGLTKKVEQMYNHGQEYSYLPDRGVFIALPKSEVITSKRAKTALYMLTGTDTDAARMALNNEFSYNDTSDIGTVDLNAYNCVIGVANQWIWLDKETHSKYYVCHKKSGSPDMLLESMCTRGLLNELLDRGYGDFIDKIYRSKVVFADYQTKRTIYYALNKPLL